LGVAPKHSKAHSTFRSHQSRSGNQFSSRDRGQGKKKKPGKAPRWIDFAFFCIDAFVDVVNHGVSWLFGSKTAAKKSSSKSTQHKAKLAKRKAKRGRHFKQYWKCTNEAKLKACSAAIAANMHWTIMYWRRKAYEEEIPHLGIALAIDTAMDDVKEDEAFWDAMPDYEDDLKVLPGLVPKRTKCNCQGCDRYNRVVLVSEHNQAGYAKAPVSIVAPSRRSFVNVHVLLLLIGIAFGMLCVPAVAMDLGDGNKSLIGKLPVFTGKRDNFIMWLVKFTALATMGAFVAAIAQNGDGSFGEKKCPKNQQKVDDILQDIADNPLTDLSNTRTRTKRAEDNEKLEIWKHNVKVFAAITLSMPNKLYRILAASDGLAHVAMQMLYHEYKPDDHMSRVEAERKYSATQLNNNGNPRYLSQRFAEIAHQHPNATADEPKKIAIILSAAPIMYQSILAAQQLALGSQCTSEHLIQAMEIVNRQRSAASEAPII
jgi:hypothetical protein